MSAKNRKSEAFGGESENYPTPRWVVDRLVDEIGDMLPRGGRWLEPAIGEGHLARAFDARIEGIQWTGYDVREVFEDLRSYCGTVILEDFTSCAAPVFGARKWAFDAAVTNPPFSLAESFVRRMTALAPLAILLLPLPWIGGSERWGLFEELPPSALYVIPDRVQFIDPTVEHDCQRCNGEGYESTDVKCPRCKGKGTVRASSPAVDHAWWVFSAFHRGPTTIHRLAQTPLKDRQWWRTGDSR